MSASRLVAAVVMRTALLSRAMPRLYVATITGPTPSSVLRRHLVSSRTYRVTEIVGTSPEGIDQAVRNGIERAARTLRHVDWFEVTQVRGHVIDGTVDHFQVGMKVGFRLEDD